ncbi:MAG: hypothetical protein ACOC4M_15975 [Promethearchaeia archaeon]
MPVKDIALSGSVICPKCRRPMTKWGETTDYVKERTKNHYECKKCNITKTRIKKW